MVPSPPLPLVRDFDCFDPLEILTRLASLRHPFLLHSSLLNDRGRWSFFGAEPFEWFRGHNYEIVMERWRSLAWRARLDEEMSTLVPFTGGAVGYWAHDLGRRLGRGLGGRAADPHLPGFVLGFYDVVGAFDHASRQCWLFSSGLPYGGARRERHAAARLDLFSRLLAARAPIPTLLPPPGGHVAMRPSLDDDAFARAVGTAQEHIARGDVARVHLSRRWTLPLAGPDGALGPSPLPAAGLAGVSLALHAALAEHAPAPFAAFLGAGDHTIVSASPERFVDLRGRRVEMRPITCTWPRNADPGEERRVHAGFEACEQDRAACAAIVDGLSEDLGAVCEKGSVRATRLCEVEAFPEDVHITSILEGRLGEGFDAFDLLHACLPGGTVTGSPRQRAMEIIGALEPVPRHIHGGSIGYLDWRGDADWSLATHTALVTARAIHVAAGALITAGTEADAECERTLRETEGLRRALACAFGVEPAALPVPA